jgi:hypothetical protein
MYTGFGLVTGFADHLQFVTTGNYSSVINSHTTINTSSQSAYLHQSFSGNGFNAIDPSTSVFTTSRPR